MLMVSPVAMASSASPSRAAALVEVTAMLGLLLSYIWGWQRSFRGDNLVVAALYFGLCGISHLRVREGARLLGLRLDNWRSAVRQAALPVAVAISVPLVIGAALGTWHFHFARLPFELPWHVAWGTAQQYGLLCLFYRRSVDALASPAGGALAAASAFALCHVPNPLLIGVTFFAGLVSCTLYRRVPNVFVLGVAHATISLVLWSALPLSVTHNLRVGPGYFTAATELLHAH
jgi:hypothetical protein